ncbi:MAG: hypothetical protein AAFO07_17220 [Bacteroidota bacterium]
MKTIISKLRLEKITIPPLLVLVGLFLCNIITAQPYDVQLVTNKARLTIDLYEFNRDSIIYYDPIEKVYLSSRAEEIQTILGEKNIDFISVFIPAESKKVLLRQVFKGQVFNLVQEINDSTEYYIVESQKNVVKIPKSTIEREKILEQLAGDRKRLRKQAKFVKHNEKSLKFYLKNLNSSFTRVLPLHPRIGLTGGLQFARIHNLYPSMNYENIDIKYGKTFFVGIFGEVHVVADFYASLQFIYSEQELNIYDYSLESHWNHTFSYNAFEIPLDIKYYFQIRDIHPFVSVGTIYFLTGRVYEESATISTESHGKYWLFAESEYANLDPVFGYSIGTGLSIPIDHKRMLSINAPYKGIPYFLDQSPRRRLNYFSLGVSINY